MNLLNLNAIKRRMVTLTTVCLALLCLGMTADEAQQIYIENECTATKRPEQECVQIECAKISEMVTFYVAEWETVVPEPIPEPEPEPDPNVCVATWCSAPLISCGDTPIEGFDSCGEKCIKPSAIWKHCLDSEGNMVDWDG